MKKLPTREEIIDTLFDKWTPKRRIELVSINDALNRVLAQNYKALYSIPYCRSSAMDGVAVDSRRFLNGIPNTSKWIKGKDYCRADTGDDFDDRFDAVIPIEFVDISINGEITFSPEVKVCRNMNVNPCGSMVAEGEIVGKQGTLLRSFDLSCLAMGGITEVNVYSKPKVTFLPTGSELIPLGERMQRGKNIDSNSILVRSMLVEMGAEPTIFPIIKDNEYDLNVALDKAVEISDVVILSGGSSKGEEDFNADILEKRGATLFHWVAAAPGKPMCVALIDNKPIINIPGPPLAMLYGMDWCTRAIVNRILNIPMPKRIKIKGRLTEKIVYPADMEIFCLMDVERDKKEYKVKQKLWKNGRMTESIRAGAFYITELGKDGVINIGEKIDVTLLRDESEF